MISRDSAIDCQRTILGLVVDRKSAIDCVLPGGEDRVRLRRKDALAAAWLLTEAGCVRHFERRLRRLKNLLLCLLLELRFFALKLT